MELYKELLPSRVYAAYKTGTSHQINTICRMCGKVSKSLAHVLAECSSLALAKYMDKHNAARKVLLFEMLRDFQACRLCSSVVLTGGAQTVIRVRKRSSILGCSCLRRTRFRSRQQGRRTIFRPQGDEGAGSGNELPMVGQSREEGFCEEFEVTTTPVGAYQTVPRLQDRTAKRYYGARYRGE